MFQNLRKKRKERQKAFLKSQYLKKEFSQQASRAGLNSVKGKTIGLASELEIKIDASALPFLKAEIKIDSELSYVLDEKQEKHYFKSTRTDLLADSGELMQRKKVETQHTMIEFTDSQGKKVRRPVSGPAIERTTKTTYHGIKCTKIHFFTKDMHIETRHDLNAPFYVLNKNPLVYVGYIKRPDIRMLPEKTFSQ